MVSAVNTNNQESTTTESSSNHNSNEDMTESMKKIFLWMDRDVKIETHQGRMFRGKLSCFDQQQNVLLSNAYELMFGERCYREFLEKKHKEAGTTITQQELEEIASIKFQKRKELGVVIVPMKQIKSCLVSKKMVILPFSSSIQKPSAAATEQPSSTTSTTATTQ